MEFVSTQKFLLISPKKVRPIADAVRKLTPGRALEVLPFVGKKGAEPLAKVIKSAMANATNKGASSDSLTIKEIQIMQGPTLKRGRPVSRGRYHPIQRKMSHIRVVLESKEPPKEEKKGKKKNGTKN